MAVLLAKDRLLLWLLRLRESNDRDDDRTRDKVEAIDFDVFEEAVAIEGANDNDDDAPRDFFSDLSCAAASSSVLLREMNEEGDTDTTEATSTPSWVEVIADDSGSCNTEDAAAAADDDDSPSCS